MNNLYFFGCNFLYITNQLYFALVVINVFTCFSLDYYRLVHKTLGGNNELYHFEDSILPNSA